MKYDDASWHYDGDFPKDLPREAGGTHIGMFLAWAILRDLLGELLKQGSAESVQKVRERRMTGAQFLFKECDEKLTDEDLSEVGNSFAQQYYEDNYLDDFCDVFDDVDDEIYRVEDSWSNFDRLVPTLDRRFREWQQGQE